MANLGYFKVNTNGKYVKLSEITGLTIASGTTYLLQVEGACRVCESATEPEGGFYINKAEPFSYTAGDADLWVKTNGSCYINIAE